MKGDTGELLLRDIIVEIPAEMLADVRTPLSIALPNLEFMMLLQSRFTLETQKELERLKSVSIYRTCKPSGN